MKSWLTSDTRENSSPRPVSYRVELIDDAFQDLERVNRTGRILDFLAKLVRIEPVGAQAGEPLGHRERMGQNLIGWRKIVMGDRDWRIVFRVEEQARIATVLVIGDRADAQCYEEALRRLERLPEHQGGRSLSDAMLTLLARRASRR